jgi:quercetin dioxygenase-like cupin family protein
VVVGQEGMAARFEPGTAEAEVVGQEAREGAHLDHGQETAGAERGEDLGENPIGIRHVVEGRGRPHQVEGVDGRPRRVPAPHGVTVAKMRVTDPAPGRGPDGLKVHPGKDWFTVLSGTVVLLLGERTILVETGQAAEFSTMIPHAFGAHDGPAEILGIFDHDGRRTHLRVTKP